MFFIYFISSLITNSIYYINLSRLHDKKISDKKLMFMMFCGTIVIAFLNTIKKTPTLNLLINLTYFICITHFFFSHKRPRDYIPDVIVFMVIVLLDGILYTIFQSVITVEINRNSELFFTFASSLTIFFINLVSSKFIIKNELYNIPGVVIILFFFTFLLHIAVVGVLNVEIASMKENEHIRIISVFISIGLVFTDLTLFHYLDYIEAGHMREKDNILKDKKDEFTTQYYESLKEKYDQQRKLTHDFNNQLHVIINAFESGNKELADIVIKEIGANYAKNVLKVNTSSEILNIIVNDKIKKAEEYNIQFEFLVEPSVNFSFISDFDMITLFGNFLDNAIEANLKLDNDRFITTNIYMLNSMLIISSKNNYNRNLVYKQNKLVSTKNNHKGFGLLNIEEIVDKYNGLLEYKDELGIFQMKIALPILASSYVI